MERPEPITVSKLNAYVKAIIDNDELLNNVYIKGEISNLKKHYTGHYYFTLKDKDSLIKCVMFKSYTSYLNFDVEDGMNVVILGTVAVYERDGIYQIYAKGMELDGVGDLYAAYEKLKAKLEAEGLFEKKYKKKIPYLPKEIGVVTSKTGAVIRDIINVTTRRYPMVHIKLYPASVQGKGAAETIVKGIEYFNKSQNVDLIIIARGGGSLEDLWPFNEEITARAIFASKIPIISAVGHETDFTIADFVADLRAPTPSAAGELAVPDIMELKWKLNNMKLQLGRSLKKRLELMQTRYSSIINRKVFKEPNVMLADKILALNGFEKDLNNCMKAELKDRKNRFEKVVATLDSLSPLKTLSRGYTVLEDKNGDVVTTSKDLKGGDVVKIILHDGTKNAEVI